MEEPVDQSKWLYKFISNTADRPTANDAIRVENLLKHVVKKQETWTSGHKSLTHSQGKPFISRMMDSIDV